MAGEAQSRAKIILSFNNYENRISLSYRCNYAHYLFLVNKFG